MDKKPKTSLPESSPFYHMLYLSDWPEIVAIREIKDLEIRDHELRRHLYKVSLISAGSIETLAIRYEGEPDFVRREPLFMCNPEKPLRTMQEVLADYKKAIEENLKRLQSLS